MSLLMSTSATACGRAHNSPVPRTGPFGRARLALSHVKLRRYEYRHGLHAATADSVATAPADLLYAKTPAGATETLQVVSVDSSSSPATLTVQWKGQTLRLSPRSEGGWSTEKIGCYPAEGGELLRAFPAMSGRLLLELHEHAGPAPTAVSSWDRVHSLGELEAAATADATLWTEGTRPGAPEKTPLQAATLTAGELVALMQGKRGVVIVQLWNGFEPARGQPLFEPYVVGLLERALATPGVRAVTSTAPGGVGLTAVLFADKEPFNVWGPHLASFGCQANAVAGSAYYKVLIGKILGYADENIYGYVRSLGGGLTPAIISQVEADLKKLSKAKPKLPWNREGSRGGKKTAQAAGGAPGAGQQKGGGKRK
ncbi:hypothetical protein CHLRE_16g648000v5 [Chlamydomonas reinhardtii]|uniref:Uncharacterized protein n=1 Tax=Chlamydomonas reinhardtii TaxID=3055 RepID=A8J9N0_CHLRE|nr:uncharacterized protein CHLRE_16g648000v5 [Chlamydomonas reinhardtii]PNW71289.1 hypothetical protein CHLRE_16g648000v5 [Chlamydomonas reinhardtii]|eukprot:XP_001698195.1 predicted protein [Chlamydomonas reinhardtii]